VCFPIYCNISVSFPGFTVGKIEVPVDHG